jgi:hypothetical protein
MAHVPCDLRTTDDRTRSVDEAVKQLAASLSAIADVEIVPLGRVDSRVRKGREFNRWMSE